MTDKWKPSTGWRKRWLMLRYRFGQVRGAIRHVWWRWSGERERVMKERDEWKAAAAFRFEQARRAWDLAYQLQYPPAGPVGALQIAADAISQESPNEPCEFAWVEWDTNASNCSREQHGLTCWCAVADELRALSSALEGGLGWNRELVEMGRMGAPARKESAS